jgi:hypothetical protein
MVSITLSVSLGVGFKAGAEISVGVTIGPFELHPISPEPTTIHRSRLFFTVPFICG